MKVAWNGPIDQNDDSFLLWHVKVHGTVSYCETFLKIWISFIKISLEKYFSFSKFVVN